MQLHTLGRKTKNKTVKRVGRGGRRGKTSGRGHKGQKGHGGTPRPVMRDIIKKLPKKRGYRFSSRKPKPAVINVGQLNGAFSDGDVINPVILLEKELIHKSRSRVPQVKILGQGVFTKKCTTFNPGMLDKKKKRWNRFIRPALVG